MLYGPSSAMLLCARRVLFMSQALLGVEFMEGWVLSESLGSAGCLYTPPALGQCLAKPSSSLFASVLRPLADFRESDIAENIN